MLKKIICILVSAFVVFACGKKESAKNETAKNGMENLNLPSWVLDPRVEGKVAAVGISPASKGGLKVQIAQAETDARANIAQQISSEISRITKDSLQKAQVENNESYQAAFTQATKDVVKNIPLTGAVRQNIYKDSTSGELYVHMILDPANVQAYLAQSLDAFSNSLASAGATRKTIEATQQAMKPLFDELDFERNSTQTQAQ